MSQTFPLIALIRKGSVFSMGNLYVDLSRIGTLEN